MNPILKSIIHKQRRDFERLCSGLHISEQVLEGVWEERNIRYADDGDPAHVMDLFYPNTLKLPAPVIINIHGGGLITGNKDFNRLFCIKLCQMGFIVFSLEYRLCPEVTFFQQLEDIYAAMNRIDGMIPELKAEPGQCFMVGDSVGALLAMYAAAIQRNPELARTADIRPSYLEIRALGLISGMFYTTKLDKIGLVMPNVFYGAHYRKHSFYPYLNPNKEAVAMYLPPCLLTTSKHDSLRSYSYYMTEAIRLQDVPCILYDYGNDPDLTHAFPVCAPEHPKSQEVIEDIASFFMNHK